MNRRQSELTDDQVREIKEKLKARKKMAHQVLAIEFDVSRKVIDKIRRGELYAHVIV